MSVDSLSAVVRESQAAKESVLTSTGLEARAALGTALTSNPHVMEHLAAYCDSLQEEMQALERQQQAIQEALFQVRNDWQTASCAWELLDARRMYPLDA